MRMLAWVVIAAACTSAKSPATAPQGSSSGSATSAPPPVIADAPPVVADAAAPPVDAAPPATGGLDNLDDGITYSNPDGGSPGTVEARTVYRSNCATTHPIARDVCQGAPIPTDKMKSCASLHVKMFKPCKKGAPTCYVEQKCSDGRVVPSDFLECAAEQNGRCFTKSSRIYKDDIAYLSEGELDDLADQIAQLKVARYRYKGEPGKHLGFIIEDAPDGPWVSDDHHRVDLYALLASSIAAIQKQDARIRQLEHDIEACKR